MMLAVATDLVRGKEGADATWIREWFTGEFMLLAPDGKVLAVVLGAPPPALANPLRIEVVGDTEYLAYLLPAGRPELPQRFTFSSLGNRRVVAFPLMDSIYGIHDPRLATVTTVYHEAFHLYQLTNRWFYDVPDEASLSTPRVLVEREEFQALASRERSILAEALAVPQQDSLRTLLQAYVQLRSSRMDLLPPQYRITEAEDERKEASAHLIGYRAGLLAVEGSTDRLAELIRSDLIGTPRFDDPRYTMGAYRQWHIYATGTAIAVLLERLGVPWEEQTEGGATFWDLLNSAIVPGAPRY